MWDTPRLWLLPWIALLAIVAAIPLLVWPERARRSLFSPIAFAAWFHILPSFVLGGLVLAAGFTFYFYSMIPVPEETLPWALSLTAIGFLSLYAGYALPWGRRAGVTLSRMIPNPHWAVGDLAPVSVLAMLVAIGINAVAFRQGLIGFQVPGVASSAAAAGTIVASTSAVTATVLLMQILFWPGAVAGRWKGIAAAALSAWVVADTLSSGRRGALLQFVVLGIGVWSLAGGPRLTARRAAVIATVTVTAVLTGMIYGTTLRQVLVQEARITPAEYAAAAGEAFRRVGERGATENAAFSLNVLAARLENVSSVAIIVGNYDRLRPFEEAFGLQDNIRTSLLSAFIPRAVWPDKPSVSDPRALGELYFGYRNSFAVTPVADLVRNFGPWGVPVGMALLGLLLRIGYAALVEDQPPTLMRTTAYVVLITSVSYEGFYGSIVPGLIRTAGVLALILAGAHVGMRATARLRRQAPAAVDGHERSRRREGEGQGRLE